MSGGLNYYLKEKFHSLLNCDYFIFSATLTWYVDQQLDLFTPPASSMFSPFTVTSGHAVAKTSLIGYAFILSFVYLKRNNQPYSFEVA